MLRAPRRARHIKAKSIKKQRRRNIMRHIKAASKRRGVAWRNQPALSIKGRRKNQKISMASGDIVYLVLGIEMVA